MEPGLTMILAHVLISALLLLVLLKTPLGWAIKLGLIVLVSAFYWLHFQQTEALRGWPSAKAPPDSFRLLTTHVVEPDKQKGHNGAIYLWGVPEDRPDDTPRAFTLPYTPPMHESAAEAEAMIADGRVVTVKQEEEEVAGAQADSDGGGTRYVFVEAPKRQLPPKK